MKKVAIYARISTDKQESENQLSELRSFCKRSEYEIHGEYVDVITGSTADRNRFKDLLSDAHKRKFDMVLFWSLDRFSREGSRKTLELLTTLESYGVSFKSYTEQYVDTAGIFKDAIIALLAALAKQERQRIQERVKAGINTKKKNVQNLGKKWKWGRTPVPEETQQHILELRMKGLSMRKVAEEVGVSLGSVHKTLAILGDPLSPSN
jgi:DNA invertase Pin-like site-specific DNA recombinase